MMKSSSLNSNLSTILKNSKKNTQIVHDVRPTDEPNPEIRLYQNNLEAEREFLNSFMRDLDIDHLVDAMQVDLSIITN